MSPCSRVRGWMVTGLQRIKARPGVHPQHDGHAVFGWQFLLGALASATIVASVVHLLGDSLAFLEMPAFTFANAVVDRLKADPSERGRSNGDPVLAGMALVAIDEDRFRRAGDDAAGPSYEGTSPLARCALLADLRQLLGVPGVQSLTVDISLAPPLRTDDAQRRCQKEIDRLIDDNAGRMVLIEPLNKDLKPQIDWMAERQAKGTRFASSKLNSEYGMVRRYLWPKSTLLPPLGELYAHAACRQADMAQKSAVCTRFDADPDPELKSPPEGDTWYPILFRHMRGMFREGAPMTIDDPCLHGLNRPVECTAIRHLLFGGTYGSGDQFLTPIGIKSGMEVHAAIASRPRAERHAVAGFVLDIVIGAIFIAPWLKFCWSGYFKSATGAPVGATNRLRDPDLAWLWLLLLTAGLGLILIVLLIASVYAYAASGAWISPAPMAVGMAIDAFVIQGVETAQHQLPRVSRRTDEAPAPPASQPGAWRRIGHALPCLTALAIIAFAVQGVLSH